MADHSYLTDPDVPLFPDDRPIMVFDGYCGLCSGFIDFIFRHDKKGELRFLPAQSDLGEALYAHYGLKTGDYDTVLLIMDGRLYVKMDASLRIIGLMGWPWKAIEIGRLLPKFVANPLYDLIARNRISWFGAREICRLPSPQEKGRFL